MAIYVLQPRKHEVISQFSMATNDTECLTVRSDAAMIVVVYKPPAGNKLHFFARLEDILRYLSCSGLPFSIMGDVNIDMLSANPPARQMSELINSFSCLNLITKATRVTPESATLLDICISNVHPPGSISGLLSVEVSDNLPTFYSIPLARSKSKARESKESRIINNQALEFVRCLISNTDWRPVLNAKDANKAYDMFFDKLVLLR